MVSSKSFSNIISEDMRVSKIMAVLYPEQPVKIDVGGRKGILLDELQYEGLIETLQILRGQQNIVDSLATREVEDTFTEEEFLKYV